MKGSRMALRSRIKTAGLSLLSETGVVSLCEWLASHALLAVTYHRVVPRDASGVRPRNCVFTDEFAEQMRFVAARYHVPDAVELRAILEGQTTAPRWSIAITFDDGYENNFQYALPILRRHGLHAIVFLTTDLIGATELLWFDRLDALLQMRQAADLLDVLRSSDAPLRSVVPNQIRAYLKRAPAEEQDRILSILEATFRPSQPDRTSTALMSWDQVRGMIAAGVTIGSHTARHQILSCVSPARAASEVRASREHIERETGQPCWCFAYPNGTRDDFSSVHEQELRHAGYTCAFTQISGVIRARTPRFALPRIPVPDSGDLRVFRFHVSGMRHPAALRA